MISETALDNAKPMDTTTEEPNVTMSSVEQTALVNVEDEQKAIDKPKRPGRKKRDLSSTSDIQTENADNTQPLFEQPVIVEGKRSRKPTSRLELSDLTTPKKELSIPEVNSVYFIREFLLEKISNFLGSWKTIRRYRI